jgi:competence protein ComEC
MEEAAVLKVGHHGSSTSSSPRFLDVVRPRFALVSAGERNPWGHPDEAVLERLRRGHALVLRTDRGGALQVRVDAGGRVGGPWDRLR